jgi:acyl-CoA synthetase (AMP-forming)/AMP-acid ligase II
VAVIAALVAGAHAAPFLQVGDQVESAQGLARRVEAVARGLLAAGLQPGDRLAILLPRGIDEVVALLAVAAAGGIAVPIHGKLKDEQVAHVLADCAPFALVTSGVRLLALRDPRALLGERRVYAAGSEPLPVAATPLPQRDR